MSVSKPEIALNGDTILKAYRIAGNNVDSLVYLQEALGAKDIKRAFDKTSQSSILATIDSSIAQQIEYLQSLRKKEATWSGDISSVDKMQPTAANFQMDAAQKQVANILSANKELVSQNITLIYQIEESAQFLRGYMKEGQLLDETKSEDKQLLDNIDQVFQSWLVEHNMLSKDGAIYVTDPKNESSADADLQRVNPAVFSKEIDDPVNGLLPFAKTIDPTLNIEIRQQVSNAAPQERASS